MLDTGLTIFGQMYHVIRVWNSISIFANMEGNNGRHCICQVRTRTLTISPESNDIVSMAPICVVLITAFLNANQKIAPVLTHHPRWMALPSFHSDGDIQILHFEQRGSWKADHSENRLNNSYPYGVHCPLPPWTRRCSWYSIRRRRHWWRM